MECTVLDFAIFPDRASQFGNPALYKLSWRDEGRGMEQKQCCTFHVLDGYAWNIFARGAAQRQSSVVVWTPLCTTHCNSSARAIRKDAYRRFLTAAQLTLLICGRSPHHLRNVLIHASMTHTFSW